MRYQLPAWSPVSLGALARGLAPSPGAADRLAHRIGSEYGARQVILTGSGTDALALSIIAAAPLGRRPRVALPAWACYDLMTAADAADAEVILYDLFPETLNPDPDSLRLALAREPHVVVIAHWFGLPVDLAALGPMVREAGALLIDDAAQGVGASVRGKPAGSGGDFGILSFGRGKGRTGGAGGAVMAFSDAALDSLARVEASLGRSGRGVGSVLALAGQWLFGRPWLYGIPAHFPGLRLGDTIYHSAAPPRRIAARNASIAAAGWDASAAEAERRRANADRWRTALTGVDDLHSYSMSVGAIAGWLRYPVLTSQRVKEIFRRTVARRYGVMPGYPATLADLPVQSGRFLVGVQEMCGARTLAERLYSLPTHSRVGSFDLEIIRKSVQPGQL
jgi:perosamine synthetase